MGALGLVQNAVIDSGENLSSAISVGHGWAIAIDMPDAFEDDGAPIALTFQGSSDGVRFLNLYDGLGNEVTIVAAVAQQVLLPRLPCLWLKVRSGTAAAPVVQGAGATLAVTVQRIPRV